MSQTYLIADYLDGNLKRVTLEILKSLLDQGQDPTVVLLGKGAMDEAATQLGARGAKKVVCLENEALGTYTTEGWANSLHSYLKDKSAGVIVTGATGVGKDFLPRLAAKFEVGLAADCVSFEVGDGVTVQRPIYAGKCSKKVTLLKSPAVFSIRPNVLPAAPEAGGSAQVEKVAADVGTIRTEVIDVQKSESKQVELAEADIIISGGRSLKSKDNFKLLYDTAAVIGAAVGASRAAVDEGYQSHDHQVGQTGKTVSPSLYIACGISGQIQHLAGMRTSKVIVAINNNPEAPIFQKADYGIVGDLFEVVPHLKTELEKLKAQG